jgi:hypothetical protein
MAVATLLTNSNSSVCCPASKAAYTFHLVSILSGDWRYAIDILATSGFQAAAVVEEIEVAGPIGFAGNFHSESQIRMSLGAAYDLVDLSREGWKEEAKNYSYLILEDRLLSEWDTVGYEVQVASTHLDLKAIPDFLRASSTTAREELRVKQGIRYFLIQKK